MFSIEAQFSISDLENRINDGLQEWFNELSAVMMEAGKKITDQAIEKARAIKPFDGGGFGNITYNLRSSIGCGLFINSAIKEDYFPFGKGAAGQTIGRELMNSVAGELDADSMGLIFVAGEKYGVFVQEKGYDVTEMSWADLETKLFK